MREHGERIFDLKGAAEVASARENTGLQIIFSIIIGLMVAAFIGVGVYTFYPPPDKDYQKQIQELYRQQEDIQTYKEPSKLSAAEQKKLQEIQDQIRALEDKHASQREVWGRNTSIVLITLATIVMSISLIRADQLPVISNGLLLGGVFTMIYGVGFIIATGTSYARFAVMTVALVITLVLGWVRFVRVKQAKAEAGGAAGAGMPAGAGAAQAGGSIATAEAGALAARIEALERRMDAAASALGEERPDKRGAQ